MSLMVIRWLLKIDTPPKNRLPVQTYVVEKNNFEVLFLDGDNYIRELTKYPDLLNNYFTLRNPLLLVQESDVKISSFISEFEKGVDIVPDSASFFYLERGNSFYLYFII